ncbi:hypothetical protein [Mesorhizobium sp. GbtcB19]|uniref:hypothetical protein n=1 Tax=Mesorhizobium sp. GbtcB19 TaxID=2824764 RepID=UPI001C3057B0|nr:hypothetical protein [Mesorhizobium sp. GbtcB19]
MRYTVGAAGFCLTALLLGGCAVPPDVKDFSGVDSYEIVKRVRCEMRDAVRQKAKEEIARINPDVAARLNSDEDFLAFDAKSLAGLTGFAKQDLNRYKDTIVGYDFSFDITENNNADVDVDLLHTFSRGTLGLGIHGADNRERNSLESFRTVDSFWRLATGVSNKDYCGSGGARPVNYAYPITGNLNLIRYVKKFLDLNQSGNLADTAGGSNISSYNISLKFTTVVNGKVSPTLTLPTRAKSFELADVKGNLEANRQDIHKVTIVFVLAPGTDKRAVTFAEQRVQEELDYLRNRDDLRSFRE